MHTVQHQYKNIVAFLQLQILYQKIYFFFAEVIAKLTEENNESQKKEGKQYIISKDWRKAGTDKGRGEECLEV